VNYGPINAFLIYHKIAVTGKDYHKIAVTGKDWCFNLAWLNIYTLFTTPVVLFMDCL